MTIDQTTEDAITKALRRNFGQQVKYIGAGIITINREEYGHMDSNNTAVLIATIKEIFKSLFPQLTLKSISAIDNLVILNIEIL